MSFTIDQLGETRILQGLPTEQLAWFAAHGEHLSLARGDRMFEPGQPADHMFIVIVGLIEGYEQVDGRLLRVATTGPGQVTGMLPFSRMTHYPRFTVAAEDTQVLRIRKKDFWDMLVVSHEVGQRLVAEMADRVRGDVRLEQQHEKMAALGRLSAGLAHELNNPAAAARRAAAGLTDELQGLLDLMGRFGRHQIDDAQLGAVERLRALAAERAIDDVTPLVRSGHEEQLGEWLEARGIARAWDVAGTLADAGLTVADLDTFASRVPTTAQADALTWVACGLSAQRLVVAILSSTERISALVASVKTYAHMDRSPEFKPTDLRAGIENTIQLLSYKLKQKQIALSRDYADDLPVVSANEGELNQVWTNLFDNAIDAASTGGEVRVTARPVDGEVQVEVIDDGPGIPEDIRNRVFEPFFTTKGVGEGTGLGLDIALRIVRTHSGDLTLESRSGRTTATVRLPMSPSPIG